MKWARHAPPGVTRTEWGPRRGRWRLLTVMALPESGPQPVLMPELAYSSSRNARFPAEKASTGTRAGSWPGAAVMKGHKRGLLTLEGRSPLVLEPGNLKPRGGRGPRGRVLQPLAAAGVSGLVGMCPCSLPPPSPGVPAVCVPPLLTKSPTGRAPSVQYDRILLLLFLVFTYLAAPDPAVAC